MTRANGSTAAALLLATATLVGAVTLSAATAQASGTAAAAEVVSVLSAPSTAKDALPRSVNLDKLGGGTIEATSIRLLAADNKATYWVGVSTASDICLLVALSNTANSAAACRPVDEFIVDGLALAAYGPGSTPVHTEAYLLPDGVKVVDMPNVMNRLAGNLITGDSRSVPDEGLKLAATSEATSQGFTIRLFGDVELPPIAVRLGDE